MYSELGHIEQKQVIKLVSKQPKFKSWIGIGGTDNSGPIYFLDCSEEKAIETILEAPHCCCVVSSNYARTSPELLKELAYFIDSFGGSFKAKTDNQEIARFLKSITPFILE